MLRHYYGVDCAGKSVPASEHSTITAWGRENEVDAFRNMLDQYPQGIVSCVSDSYDIYRACEQYWGTELYQKVIGRKGFVVVRPDSGKLPDIVIEVLEMLESRFGSSPTSTGHRILPECIRVLQGDGIDIFTMEKILKTMKDKGWAVDNVIFGSGGALLQKLHRDTLKCAFKCSAAVVEGNEVDVLKDPITDPGKKSKKGRLSLHWRNGTWTTVCEGKGDPEDDWLQEIFRNGKLILEDNFGDIRKRAEVSWQEVSTY